MLLLAALLGRVDAHIELLMHCDFCLLSKDETLVDAYRLVSRMGLLRRTMRLLSETPSYTKRIRRVSTRYLG